MGRGHAEKVWGAHRLELNFLQTNFFRGTKDPKRAKKDTVLCSGQGRLWNNNTTNFFSYIQNGAL